MLALILLEVLIALNITHCLKQRKFYQEYGTEVTGTVVTWKKMSLYGTLLSPMFYALMVCTDEGTFYVETTNRKARKYHEGKEVTILIVPHSPFPELPPETLERLTPEDLETIQKLREAEARTVAKERKLTILKDDMKRVSEMVFCALAGVFFGIILVAEIIDRLT